MQISYEEKVRAIIASDAYGLFMEVGAGQPLSNAIFMEPGASKTIEATFCPYGYLSQEDIFTSKKAVSRERITEMLEDSSFDWKEGKKENFCFFSTISLLENNSHGWVGIFYKGEKYIFHFTIPEHKMDKKFVINLVKELCIDLAYNVILGPQLSVKYVDVALNITLSYDVSQIYYLDSFKGDSVTVFLPQKDYPNHPTMMSLNDAMYHKKSKGVIIAYKGSFNPIHEGHLEIMDQTKRLLLDDIETHMDSFFVLSYSTLFKDQESIINYMKRIIDITNKGGKVILVNNPYFINNHEVFLNCQYIDEVVFPMGLDTWDRFDGEQWDLFLNLKNMTAYVFDRKYRDDIDENTKNIFTALPNIHYIPFDNPISSTKIREQS